MSSSTHVGILSGNAAIHSSRPSQGQPFSSAHTSTSKWHTAPRLDKLWRLKSRVLQCIIDAEGGNQYKMPYRNDMRRTPPPLQMTSVVYLLRAIRSGTCKKSVTHVRIVWIINLVLCFDIVQFACFITHKNVSPCRSDRKIPLL